MVKEGEEVPTPISLVSNWTEELNRARTSGGAPK
jgi:hypothetical protein